jgi:hypothetical protein
MPSRRSDEQHDRTVEESFPASDPPASTGITGPRVKDRHRSERGRGEDARPKGTPTHERHAAETAHQREPEEHPRRR